MKYNSEEYYTVRERRTGKKICDCGDFQDARMMMNLDIPNREIVKNKSLMSPVVDIEVQKSLPTTDIVFTQKLKQHQNKLPQTELKIFYV